MTQPMVCHNTEALSTIVNLFLLPLLRGQEKINGNLKYNSGIKVEFDGVWPDCVIWAPVYGNQGQIESFFMELCKRFGVDGKIVRESN